MTQNRLASKPGCVRAGELDLKDLTVDSNQIQYFSTLDSGTEFATICNVTMINQPDFDRYDMTIGFAFTHQTRQLGDFGTTRYNNVMMIRSVAAPSKQVWKQLFTSVR